MIERNTLRDPESMVSTPEHTTTVCYQILKRTIAHMNNNLICWWNYEWCLLILTYSVYIRWLILDMWHSYTMCMYIYCCVTLHSNRAGWRISIGARNYKLSFEISIFNFTNKPPWLTLSLSSMELSDALHVVSSSLMKELKLLVAFQLSQQVNKYKHHSLIIGLW